MAKGIKNIRHGLVKDDAEVFRGGRSDDIIIPVMGHTGVGKSTFINTVLGINRMTVGHGMASCTAEVECEIVDPAWIARHFPALRGRRVIMVDTPGFDDTYLSDVEILRRIGVWLASAYCSDMKLGGIIYLTNIADRQVTPSNRRNFETFKALCGRDAFCRVILGTTSWQEVKAADGERRERDLIQKVWQEMIDHGSQTMRFDALDIPSAREIVAVILHRLLQAEQVELILRIQEELVDLRKHIPQTDAGKRLICTLKEIDEMKKEMRSEDQEGEERLQTKLKSLKKQMDHLRLPLFTRIKNAFSKL